MGERMRGNEKHTGIKEYQARRVLDERFILGEGPFYDYRGGTLTWVDIKTGTLHGLEPDGERFWIQTGQYLGAAIPYKEGSAYMGVMTTGLYRLEKTSIHRVFSLENYFHDFQRANDAKCDGQGRLWFGSMPLFQEDRERGGNLYCFTPNTGCEKKISHTIVANGMAWTEDEKTFYFVDSGHRSVYAYEYRKDKGEINNGRVVLTLEHGTPDGMTIDSEGMLWIAVWGGGMVGRYEPETGKLLERVNVPAAQVSSCCFGGPQRDILYITSSGEGMNGAEDGCLFACKVDASGMDNVCYG